jgi:uncharacterized protein RhaS with RHS repeats
VQTASYAYNAANQVQGWTYDAAGNLTNDRVTACSFNALSRARNQALKARRWMGGPFCDVIASTEPDPPSGDRL